MKLGLSILLLLFITTFVRGYDICASTSKWRSTNNRIELNGQEFRVKGLNWWGFEDSGIQMLTGLEHVSIATMLNFMNSNGFNALRIPLSVDWVLHPNRMVQGWSVVGEPLLQGKTGLQALDFLFSETQNKGIAIVLDFHWFITFNSQLGYWYSIGECVRNQEGECLQYTEQTVMSAWSTIIARYKGFPNFMGVDFINEAFSATWGLGAQNTDWDLYVNRQVADITSKHPDFNGLFFIEGIADAPTPSGCNLQQTPGHWWGGNFEMWKCKPLSVPDNTRIVWCPHTYGPSLYAHTYFSAPNYPDNMPAIWNAHFGYLKQQTSQAIVVGEWGGVYTGSTKVFQDAFASYLASNGFGSFYWAFISRPGEVDTVDGVVVANSDGTLTANSGKLAMLAVAVPRPTTVLYSSSCSVASTATTSSVATTTTTASTSATTLSTSATSVTSSTFATSATSVTSATATSGSGSCAISVTQTAAGSWTESGATATQYNVRFTNTGSQNLQVKFSFVGTPTQTWTVTALGNNQYGLPSWLASGLAPGNSIDWGYIVHAITPLSFTFIVPSCGSGSATIATSATSATSGSTSATSATIASTATSATSATTATSSTSSSTGNTGCSYSITQRITNSWSDSGPVTQFEAVLANTGTSTIKALLLSAGAQASSITQLWNLDLESAGTYKLPSWSNKIDPSTSITFGYIVRGSASISWQKTSTQC